MSGSYNFWVLIDWLKNNDDNWSQIEPSERIKLQSHIKIASTSNILTGIPVDSILYVKSLVNEVKLRLEAQQAYFQQNKGYFRIGR